jgi:hypothetical protein
MAKDRGEEATPPSLNSPPLMVACIASPSFGRDDDVDGDCESANSNLEPRMRLVGEGDEKKRKDYGKEKGRRALSSTRKRWQHGRPKRSAMVVGWKKSKRR